MIKYKLADSPKEKTVEVGLCLEDNGSVWLIVGCWAVFELLPNGKGRLPNLIPENNSTGLQVNENGSIILEEK